MNVVRLCGGIGNQFFQYAFGRAQMQNGLKVCYNKSWYDKPTNNSPHRSYQLDKFSVDVEIHPFLRSKTVNENGFDPSLLKVDNCNFLGYWQHIGYIESVRSILKKEFCVREELMTKQFSILKEAVTYRPSTSVHARRGDYLNWKKVNVLTFSYYYEALKQTEGDIYIFSDDMDWCVSVFKPEYFHPRTVLFGSMEDYLDFELLKYFKYSVLSNSTFGWAPAYLSGTVEKVIIPGRWRVDSKDQEEYTKGIFPKDWILC